MTYSHKIKQNYSQITYLGTHIDYELVLTNYWQKYLYSTFFLPETKINFLVINYIIDAYLYEMYTQNISFYCQS